MKVGQRLFLAVVPAVLGVLLVGALAYWGQYAHRVPSLVLVVAIIAAVVSLVLAWQNTRYVARRVEQLAGPGALPDSALYPTTFGSTRHDELDHIESVVHRLSSDLTTATNQRIRGEEDTAARLADYRRLLVETSADVAKRLDDVRLPLHILLENRFGELNENQEEMLEAARTSAEAADTTVRRVRELAELELGRLVTVPARVRSEDVVRSVLPGLIAEAARHGVHVIADFEPPLPAILVDRARVQEALSLLLKDLIDHAPTDTEMRIVVEQSDTDVRLRIDRPITSRGVNLQLALRVIESQRGHLVSLAQSTTVTFPAASASLAD
jgi:signal transduction histidine kinase